jgi:hypothetical protein
VARPPLPSSWTLRGVDAVYFILVPFAVGLLLITLSPVGRRTPVLQALRWRTGLVIVVLALIGVWIVGTVMVDQIAD